MLSADPSSTDSNLVAATRARRSSGSPRPRPRRPARRRPPSTPRSRRPTCSAPGLETEIAGFTITSTLVGDAALGTIDPTTAGVWIQNSNILVDRDYFIDNNNGIVVGLGGAAAATPQIEDDVFAGNNDGVFIDATASNITIASPTQMVQVINNDFVFNTVGLFAEVASADPPLLANVANNIFYENHDLTTARNGAGVAATFPNAIVLRENMFQSNGASDTNASGAGFNVGNGFNSATLTTTPDPLLGNFIGAPAFVSPSTRDPAPTVRARFFHHRRLRPHRRVARDQRGTGDSGGFPAPATDLLLRSPVKIPGKGFPGTGPISVGAFDFQGTGGTPVGGSFRVVTTSVAPGGARASRMAPS